MNLSYDYSDLIDEIQSDLQEGLLELTEPIKIVRSKKVIFDNYYPIVDYYYSDDECDEEFKEMLVKDALIEMEQWNKIIK